MCGPAVAIPAALTAAGTASSIGMGIYQANQQAAYANAQDRNNWLAGQSQLRHNYYTSLLNQRMFGQTSGLQIQQAGAANKFQFKSSLQRMSLENAMQAQQMRMTQYLMGQDFKFQRELQEQQLATSVLLQAQRNRLDQQMLDQQLSLQEQQGNQAIALQIKQANAEIASRYQESRQAVENERRSLLTKHAADRLMYQKGLENAQAQVQNNNTAVNRVYVAEQQKVNEIRKKVAFDAQAMAQAEIVKAGTAMAAGRQGASMGSIMADIRRQRGFSEAQVSATLDSALQAAQSAMESGRISGQSANNQAASNVGWLPEIPYLPKDPKKPVFIDAIGLGIQPTG
jgi:hypothetical protein